MMQDNLPALIVAHGQPSAPDQAELALMELAAQVEDYAPGRVVLAATLAKAGALGAAVARLGPRGLVYPMFMAGGWFTRVALGDKLRVARATVGEGGWQVLEPFGCDAGVHDLASAVVADALRGQSLRSAQVLVAAHGSFKSSAPSAVAHAVAARLQRDLGIGRVETRFIDQDPRLEDAEAFGAGAVCLPFFAANGGHVAQDIPAALAKARFGGQILPPLGTHPDVPKLIATALSNPIPVCAQTCRFAAL